jgi:hypothetical protein
MKFRRNVEFLAAVLCLSGGAAGLAGHWQASAMLWAVTALLVRFGTVLEY